MNPGKMAVAGTLESSDVLVRVRPSEDLSIEIKSPALQQYGDAIRQTVTEVLEERGVTAAEIEIIDRGALDCTIRARLETALERAL
ncbi:MAG: citrate lyase acyl carrier protein [Eubacteriales bacterium]|nr:citrate lyase acyl carrier protein [Eubacteriales bacterium]MDD4324694.1 citrate lyase acyl carrier protein [Eubacteriales bacterium]